MYNVHRIIIRTIANISLESDIASELVIIIRIGIGIGDCKILTENGIHCV